MKLHIDQDNKRVITLYDLPAVDILRAGFTEQKDFKQELEMLTALVADHSMEVLKSSHTISKNCRTWDYYGEGSETLDIWLECTAFDRWTNTFYMLGAYLSDIWQIGPADRKAEILSHVYVRKFTEV